MGRFWGKVPRLKTPLISVGVFLLSPPPGWALEPEPLPFPVYVACRVGSEIIVDGTLDEPAWRETSLGWGLSHSIEPNVLCPDPTLFRIGFDEERLYLSLACYKRTIQEEIPEHLWKPRETDIIDLQATPRYARMRGVIPPVNTADVLFSLNGRTVTIHLAPPAPPGFRIHDALGERAMPVNVDYAYAGSPEGERWDVELIAHWEALGFAAPSARNNWSLNVYRDIRFFSNWSFVAWMRKWSKVEYSRYDITERFGRILFTEGENGDWIEERALEIAKARGPVRVFTPDCLLLITDEGRVVRQRYAERLEDLKAYADDIFRDRRRIGNDLPYHPFFSEKKPREHLGIASRKLGYLKQAVSESLPYDDSAGGVARISHAIPEARQALYTYKLERLYRGMPE